MGWHVFFTLIHNPASFMLHFLMRVDGMNISRSLSRSACLCAMAEGVNEVEVMLNIVGDVGGNVVEI